MGNTVPVPGYEGVYEISEEGLVLTIKRAFKSSTGKLIKVPAKERKSSLSSYGYLTIRLSNCGVVKTHRLHRLVAEAFIPNPNGLPIVNHKDGVKSNPHKDNLEWATAQENSAHAIETGLIDFAGENNPSAKLTEADVIVALNRCRNGELIQDVSRDFGVNRNTLPKRFAAYA